MKFTNGFWMMKSNIDAVFACELLRWTYRKNELQLIVFTSHDTDRGNLLNRAALTVTLSAPSKDAIRVNIVHFKGTHAGTPEFPLNMQTEKSEESAAPIFTDKDGKLTFCSGKTTAVISKKAGEWGIRFFYDGKPLTNTADKCQAYLKNTENGKTYITEALALDISENIYGLGERFTPFVKNGQTVDMWNADGGTASEQSYKNVPFYLSSKGYGVLVNTPSDVSFEIASEKVERCQFSQEGEQLEYIIYGGKTPKEALQNYAVSTGLPALPPAWTFGLWLTTSFTTDYSEDVTSKLIDGMKTNDIPLSVFHFDCYWMQGLKWCDFEWDKATFPDPKAMIERYHAKGLKICVWINPYIAQDSRLFEEGLKNGCLLLKENGDVWQTDLWQAGMGIVDFTNPSAVAWYKSKLKALLDMGVDSFKTDFGERIPVTGVRYYDGSDPVRMHNFYTYLYNKTVFDLLESERGKGEAALFARSATAGCQKFPIHWGGDCSASYASMAETLRGGLSLMCSGFGFWSHDISGFESTATPDLYKRWCQFGLLSSHSRLHGSSSFRVPWLFDQEAVAVLRKFTKLKCALMPYLFAQAVEAHRKGTPVLRPMFLEFPNDRTCAPLDTQYMLGNALLAAPIFSEDSSVNYYLPEGMWYNLLTKKAYQGGKWYAETYDYMHMPLLLREKAILAASPTETRPDYDYSKNITLLLGFFPEGETAVQNLVSEKGEDIAQIYAQCTGDTITLTVSGTLDGLKAESMFAQKIAIKN